MKIINKLTIRHLRGNKRRTLVTIIGVVISVAMLMAVSTLGVSFLDLLKRQTIATDGEWHVQYGNVSSSQLAAIEEDEATDELIISKDSGFANLEGLNDELKPYVFIKEFNQQGFENFPVELTRGELPKEDNEVILSEDLNNKADIEYEIGDQLTIAAGERSIKGTEEMFLSQQDPLRRNEQGEITEELVDTEAESYTVVGFMKKPLWEPAWAPGYTIISYIDKSLMKENETADAVVVLNNVSRTLYDHAEQLAADLGIEQVNFNKELLRYYGVSDNASIQLTLYSLTGIIMAVILLGSVALIYNSFAISVSERSRYLGMLSSIGATKNQKRNSVFFEGAVIGAISIPIGILAGIAGIAVTFWFINSYIDGALGVMVDLKVVTTPMSILVTCLIAITTIFISTYIPARKASKISAINAIRQSQDVKLSKKAVKTSKLIRRLFGMEGEIGLKNLKRNKRRYQVTVFSLVISIVLFLSVSFFTSNLEKSVKMTQADINYDIMVSGESLPREELMALTRLENVTEYSLNKDTTLAAWIEEEKIAEGLRGNEEALKDGEYPYQVNLVGLDQKNFQEYANEVGIDPEKLQTPESPAGIVIEQTTYQDPKTGRLMEDEAIQSEVGSRIELFATDYETGEQEFVSEVIIGALTDKVPMGVNPATVGGITIIVSENTMEQLMNNGFEEEVRTGLYLNSSDPMATQEALEEVEQSGVFVYNVFQRRQENEQLIMLMSLFTYGFIVLITLISIANIFNTISTSISLRKREFAMLRSMGMTPKGFNRMINYESIFYGLKSLLYGLPISIGVMGLIYWSLSNTFGYGFALPWLSILYVIVAIFVIVSAAMLYSVQKIKKENIIEGLQQENI